MSVLSFSRFYWMRVELWSFWCREPRQISLQEWEDSPVNLGGPFARMQSKSDCTKLYLSFARGCSFWNLSTRNGFDSTKLRRNRTKNELLDSCFFLLPLLTFFLIMSPFSRIWTPSSQAWWRAYGLVGGPCEYWHIHTARRTILSQTQYFDKCLPPI